MRSDFLRFFLLLTASFLGTATAASIVIPNGPWNLTNNVFPLWLAPLYPYDGPMFMTEKIRMITLVQTGFYEIWASYNPVAIGYYYGTTCKRPASENTTRNKNIAMAYLIHRLQVV